MKRGHHIDAPSRARKHPSRRASKLIALLKLAGRKKPRVWWEPVGGNFEMCGPAGGWFYMAENGGGPLGYSFEDACESAKAIEDDRV